MHPCFNGTFLADDLACFFTAIQTLGRTVSTLTAFLAPASYIEVTLGTLGTVSSSVCYTFFANDLTEIDRTVLIVRRALGTKHTLLAPKTYFKVAVAATGAVAVFIFGTIIAKQSQPEI